MTEPSEMEVTKAEGLDAIFRAHYDRVARVIGRVIHDRARAEELAVEVFLKWRLAIVMGVLFCRSTNDFHVSSLAFDLIFSNSLPITAESW